MARFRPRSTFGDRGLSEVVHVMAPLGSKPDQRVRYFSASP